MDAVHCPNDRVARYLLQLGSLMQILWAEGLRKNDMRRLIITEIGKAEVQHSICVLHDIESLYKRVGGHGKASGQVEQVLNTVDTMADYTVVSKETTGLDHIRTHWLGASAPDHWREK